MGNWVDNNWINDTVDDAREGNYRLVGPIGTSIGFGLRGMEVASGINLGDVGVGGVGGDTVNDTADSVDDFGGSLGDIFAGGSGIPTGDDGTPNAGIPGVSEIRGLIQMLLTGMLLIVGVYVLGTLFEFQFVFDGE